MFTHVLLIERAMAEILTPATQPLSHSGRLPQPLSHSAALVRVTGPATQPLSQSEWLSGWVAAPATPPEWLSGWVAGPEWPLLPEWLSGWVAAAATLPEWLREVCRYIRNLNPAKFSLHTLSVAWRGGIWICIGGIWFFILCWLRFAMMLVTFS